MKSFISGSHGFIGSHLEQRLKQLGHTVIPIPRAFLGQINELTNLMDVERPDYIFHLAAYGNMGKQVDEQQIFEANVIGTWNMLQASRNIPYKGFINFGSSSEYGKKKQPMNESDSPETETFYGASKVSGTYLARATAGQFNKPIVTMRPFSVYGPGEADFRLIPMLIKKGIKGDMADLEQGAYHDWIYVDDFIDGVIKVMENTQELSGQVVNIGSGEQHTNRTVCLTLSKILHDDPSHEYDNIWYKRVDNLRISDSVMWVADVSKLSRLGWYPKYSLEGGLKKTYEYYKQRFEKEDNRNIPEA